MVTRAQLIQLFVDQAHPDWLVPPEDSFPSAINGEFFPDSGNIFSAFGVSSPASVRYLVLGQDPYFDYVRTKAGDQIPYATGMAFDVDLRCLPHMGGGLPKSLELILKCLRVDNQPTADRVLCYRQWLVRNRILMFNSALTVPPHKEGAGAHARLWRDFGAAVVRQVSQRSPNAKFVAWGAKAKSVAISGLGKNKAIFTAAHPTAHDGGKSFRDFWTTEIGRELCRLAI